MQKKRRGRSDTFTPEQNAQLRAELTKLWREESLSQEGLGSVLGVGQQAASRLLGRASAGFSYLTATRLVQYLGHSGVDEFFRARGVALKRAS